MLRGVVVLGRVVDGPDEHAGPEGEELDLVRRGDCVAELVRAGAKCVVVADVLPVLEQVVPVGCLRHRPGAALPQPRCSPPTGLLDIVGEQRRAAGNGDDVVEERAREVDATVRLVAAPELRRHITSGVGEPQRGPASVGRPEDRLSGVRPRVAAVGRVLAIQVVVSGLDVVPRLRRHGDAGRGRYGAGERLFKWSALPVHHAYWPEVGVVYVFDVLVDDRLTLIA